MPKLPTKETLGGARIATPQRGIRSADVGAYGRSLSAGGEATAQVGEEISRVGQQGMQYAGAVAKKEAEKKAYAANTFQKATAQAALLRQQNEYTEGLKEDDDYANYVENFRKKSADWMATASEGIGDELTRQNFQANALVMNERFVGSLNRLADKKYRELGNRSVYEQIDAFRKSFSSAPDQKTRNAIVANLSLMLEGAVGSDFITAQQGAGIKREAISSAAITKLSGMDIETRMNMFENATIHNPDGTISWKKTRTLVDMLSPIQRERMRKSDLDTIARQDNELEKQRVTGDAAHLYNKYGWEHPVEAYTGMLEIRAKAVASENKARKEAGQEPMTDSEVKNLNEELWAAMPGLLPDGVAKIQIENFENAKTFLVFKQNAVGMMRDLPEDEEVLAGMMKSLARNGMDARQRWLFLLSQKPENDLIAPDIFRSFGNKIEDTYKEVNAKTAGEGNLLKAAVNKEIDETLEALYTSGAPVPMIEARREVMQNLAGMYYLEGLSKDKAAERATKWLLNKGVVHKVNGRNVNIPIAQAQYADILDDVIENLGKDDLILPHEWTASKDAWARKVKDTGYWVTNKFGSGFILVDEAGVDVVDKDDNVITLDYNEMKLLWETRDKARKEKAVVGHSEETLKKIKRGQKILEERNQDEPPVLLGEG